MTLKEIQELIKLVSKAELSEFKFKNKDIALKIRGKGYAHSTPSGNRNGPSIINVPAQPIANGFGPAPAAASVPSSVAAVAATEKAAGDAQAQDARLIEVKSPMIGTFYRSSSPDKPPYIKVGDRIAKGDTVCVVEAMKLFNEIEAEVSGKIVKVLVEDAQPIEYDQPLFLVDPA